MRRPKVLLFFEYATLNGGEISMLATLEALGQTEFDFVAAAPASGMLTERLEQCRVRVLPLTLRNEQGRKRSIEQMNSHLVELVTRVAPDLVHSNSLAMGRMVGRIAAQLPIPCTSHLRDIIKLSKAAVSDLNRNAGLIAVSNATKQFHVEQGVLPEKLQVIYNGVDNELFRPAPATGFLKQELGLSDNAVLLVNIGQICLRKGQTVLARAAASPAEEFPEANYLFIGQRHSQKDESVGHENAIRRIFREAGIENRLFRLGFRHDIAAILNEVDLVVHTAHQEPLGRVLLEAASSGRPIIATDVGGTPEILEDGASALLVRPDDPDVLAAAIRRTLTEHELRISLGKQARTVAVERFSLPRAVENISAFWKSFL
ncbi:MAG: glycosyltransferase family 4 protein [Planctomycetota bacterium]|jgi:glycosyltransferase involved in cell wall biosynthesis